MYERNQPCPCGSGKKYKKCCINKISNPTELRKQRALYLCPEAYNSETFVDTYIKVLNHSLRKNWVGACHTLSSILYVLFREQGINANLNIGFAKSSKIPFPFCHSWVEIEGVIYDLSLYRSHSHIPNQMIEISGPIFKGVDLDINFKTQILYGVKTTREDRILSNILSMTLGEYMDGWKQHKEGVWGEVIEIAELLKMDLDINELKSKYYNTRFIFNGHHKIYSS